MYAAAGVFAASDRDVNSKRASIARAARSLPPAVFSGLRDGAYVEAVSVGSPSRVVYREPNADEIADRVAKALCVL